jgi:uncharacterized membrane protein YbhN (UPF0104 family)
VSVVTIVAVTPGGIGLNDLAGAGALDVFGTSFPIGAQWVLANRVLVSASYLFVAAFATVAVCVVRIAQPKQVNGMVETER